MANILKFTKEKRRQFLELLRAGQTITGAAEQCGVSYWTILGYRNRHPTFDDKVKDSMKVKVHVIEDDLYLAAHAGNVDAMKFFLVNRTRALDEADRWYNVNRTELTGKDGSDVRMSYKLEWRRKKLSDAPK